MRAADQMRAYLDAVLHEYDSLRSESADARAAQRSILTFGAAGASTVVALASGTIRDLPVLSVALFLAVLPGLLTLGAILWVGEVARMRRAGDYLQAVELKVAYVLQTAVRQLKSQEGLRLPVADATFSPLEWECWLGTRQNVATRHMRWLYVWVMSAARAAAVLAPLLAIVVDFTASFPGEDKIWRCGIPLLAATSCVLQMWVWSRLTAVTQTCVGELWPRLTRPS